MFEWPSPSGPKSAPYGISVINDVIRQSGRAFDVHVVRCQNDRDFGPCRGEAPPELEHPCGRRCGERRTIGRLRFRDRHRAMRGDAREHERHGGEYAAVGRDT